MLTEEEFKAIYLNYKIKEIVPFLKKLTPKDKIEVAAILKKHINKEWGHNNISVLAALACSRTKEEYAKLSPGYYSLPIDLIEDLFESFIPEWIGESYPFLKEIEYLKVMEWEQSGYLTLADELNASLLSSSLLSADQLQSYPVILDSYIWLLFEYECSITARYHDVNWKDTLKTLVQENKIDRFRVLKSSLKAINFNFSKENNTWFLELFNYLEPTDREIVELQEELFLIFHSTQHSLFSVVLKMITPIAIHKDFKTGEFLQAVMPLVTLSSKTIINPLLQIFEKIAGNNEKYREEICLLLMPVFLNKDKAVQNKAAKIVLKYGDPASEKLQEEMKLYEGSLLADIHTLLDKFLVEQKENKEEQNYEAVVWHTSAPVLPVQTISDFIFFAPQVFNTGEMYHFDLFLDALMRFDNEFEEDHFHQLEPAFKAAFKLKDTSGFRHLLATFLINYGLFRQKKKSPILLEARLAFPDLENWVGKKTPLIFKAYHQLLLDIFEALKQNKKIPLLSVPDHSPCWISVHNLVDKLKIYQQKGEMPVPFDLEIALLRIEKEELKQGEGYAKEHLNTEYFHLLKPVFEQNYFSEHYRNGFLDGNFSWNLSYRKIYKWNKTEEIPQFLVDIESRKELPENASFPDYVFSSYDGVYDDDMIRILYTVPYFSCSVFAQKYNKNLSNAVYQYDIKESMALLDAWMKLNLPFQPVHYVFLSAGLFNKDKTFSGMAFEVLINRAVSNDFDMEELGKLIGKKISFEWAPVKRLTDGLSGFINLSTNHNIAFEKLLISILAAIEKPVFNLKKLLELYDELKTRNQSETDKTIIDLLEEWGKENNLKKLSIKLKTNERKTL
ncbi:hypothetical protein C1637_09285 [Chryseobacterium lactis]|uniref:Uncharacterized protein n=1 Tax=Chryseobacterium lactis TaxID=1241981 RepID=A0A3G6RLE0_CHRLC|nr:DUF6493 family protein [Chryseobacterium lactis]AZA82284.1 hypothetical protein EG342_10420 [Chryseobacterium lactis]AZB02666.1 hypothetical protein EG341_01280 [Chryseobacterium lactis]PNW14042.1 hypothetical protein C1637_09285 [Chryseobacterium lactis]